MLIGASPSSRTCESRDAVASGETDQIRPAACPVPRHRLAAVSRRMSSHPARRMGHAGFLPDQVAAHVGVSPRSSRILAASASGTTDILASPSSRGCESWDVVASGEMGWAHPACRRSASTTHSRVSAAPAARCTGRRRRRGDGRRDVGEAGGDGIHERGLMCKRVVTWWLISLLSIVSLLNLRDILIISAEDSGAPLRAAEDKLVATPRRARSRITRGATAWRFYL